MLETWTGAGDDAPRRRRTAAALGLIAALAIAIAGCGGGGDSTGESESAARKKLERGAEMISDAESLRLSLLLETEKDGESDTIGCVDLAADTATPESFDLIFFEQSCEGEAGYGGHEMVAIGRRAWGSTGPESWREAKITPQVLHEISAEQTDFGTLMEAAEDIEATPEGGAVEASDGRFVDATSYSFEAPASTFPGAAELGDLEVEFEATLDRHGYIRELVTHGEEDGAGATLTATYDDIDEPMEIEPPKKSEVHGDVALIRSRDELDELFGVSTP